jgi:hypothetical protein
MPTPSERARELAEHLYKEWSTYAPSLSRPYWDKIVVELIEPALSAYREEIIKAERERCADRADKWLHETFEVEEIVDDVETTLRAAIMQDKENT